MRIDYSPTGDGAFLTENPAAIPKKKGINVIAQRNTLFSANVRRMTSLLSGTLAMTSRRTGTAKNIEIRDASKITFCCPVIATPFLPRAKYIAAKSNPPRHVANQ